MALVTVARYVAITGDSTSVGSAVQEWIDDATTRLEEALDRPLASASRTERMYPTRDGSLWPHAIPITVAPDTYTVDGYRLYGALFPVAIDPFVVGRPGVDVTYTGGWVERTANPTATNRLPACIEEDIAIAAYLIGHPAPLAAQLAVPVGAQSVTLGDASINFGANGARPARPVQISWTSKTLGYRYLRIGGEPQC